MERMTSCLNLKVKTLAFIQKPFNSYIFVLVDNEMIKILKYIYLVN